MVYLARTKRKTHPLDKPGACFALKVLRKKYQRCHAQLYVSIFIMFVEFVFYRYCTM